MRTLILTLLFIWSSHQMQAQQWGRVGTGADGPVYSLEAFQDGISVGGAFKQINSFNRINHCLIRENYANNYSFFFTYTEDFNTSALDSGTLSSVVRCVQPDVKDLHIGGQFLHPDYNENVGIGRIIGGTNTAFEGYSHQLKNRTSVFAMSKLGNTLFFGGDFNDLGGAQSVGYVDLESTSPFSVEAAGDNLVGTVYCLEAFGNEMYAGGSFSIADTDTLFPCNFARWSGTEWECIGVGMNGSVHAMLEFENQLILGGAFTASDSTVVKRIATWDGTNLEPMGLGFIDSTDTVFSIGVYSDSLFVGGRLIGSGGVSAQNLYQWNGTIWQDVGSGVNGPVYALEAYRGRLYIGGSFSKADALISRNIVTYNNGTEPLGAIEYQTPPVCSVWPNPTSSHVLVQSTGSIASMTLFGVDGVLVREIEVGPSKSSMCISDLSPGSYILNVRFDTGTIQQKQIIVY